MTQLKLRNVLIWPRFHEEINEDLNAVKVDVLELRQPLSDSMKVIQQAIIDCMDATLSEIKRSHTVVSHSCSALQASFEQQFHRSTAKTSLSTMLSSNLLTLFSVLSLIPTGTR